MNGDLLTTVEVADLLRVRAETVLRWHNTGRIPGGVRLPSRQLRFRRSLLEDWMAAGGEGVQDEPMTPTPLRAA